MKDRANAVPWPPVIYVLAGGAAYALDRALPLYPSMLAGLETAGWLAVGVGLAIAIAGVVTFKSIGTVVDPTGSATALATGGIYRLTRNPMYLGALVCIAGLAMALRSGGMLVVLPIVAVALDRLAIAREEAYLERKFGAQFEDYRARVRRWL